MRLRWLIGALLLSLALLAGHLYALQHFSYWAHPWVDIPMHILGGAAVGTFLIALSQSRRPLMFLLACSAAFIAWECIEYIGGLTRTEANYVYDTAHDLLDDALGALAVYALARFSLWR